MEDAVLAYFCVTTDDGAAIVPDPQTLAAASGVDDDTQLGTQIIFSAAPVIGRNLVGGCLLPPEEIQIPPDQIIILVGDPAGKIVDFTAEIYAFCGM